MAATEQTPLLNSPLKKIKQFKETGKPKDDQESSGQKSAELPVGHVESRRVLNEVDVPVHRKDKIEHIRNLWHKAEVNTGGNFDKSLRIGLEPLPLIDVFGNMFLMVLRHYWFTILCSISSAALCCYYGDPEWTVVDPLIFKSLFVVIGFALGFRNVQASTRRTNAMTFIADMYSSAWGIIGIFANVDDEAIRKRVKNELFIINDRIAHHIMLISSPHSFTFGLVGLQPATEHYDYDCFADSGANIMYDIEEAAISHDANFSPRTQLTQFFFMCEDYINELEEYDANKEGFKGQKMIRAMWAEKATFLRSYDSLIHLSVPSVSQRYSSLIDFTLFCFGVTLAWGIHTSKSDLRSISRHLGFGACAWLLGNTIFGIFTLLCLNALAVEHEKLIGKNVDDIHMHRIAILFKTAVEGYEESRDALKSTGETGLQREKALCSSSYNDGWNMSQD